MPILPPVTPAADFMPNATLLSIIALSGSQGLVVYYGAARGLTQTYKQIASGQGNIRRSVVGHVVNLTPPWFQQYATTITCTDVTKPTFDDTWRGQDFEVHCAAELEFETGVGTPARPVVPNSERTEGHITYYRPILICCLIDFEVSFREYEGSWTWRVDLEETAPL